VKLLFTDLYNHSFGEEGLIKIPKGSEDAGRSLVGREQDRAVSIEPYIRSGARFLKIESRTPPDDDEKIIQLSRNRQ